MRTPEKERLRRRVKVRSPKRVAKVLTVADLMGALPHESALEVLEARSRTRALRPSREALALQLSLRALRSVQAFSLGKCEDAQPFSDMRFVRRNGVLYVCCGHDPQHCSKVG